MNSWLLSLKQGRTIALIASLVFLSLIFYFFSEIVGYIIMAWVLSMVGAPLMNVMKRIKIYAWTPSSSIRAVITICTFIVVAILIIWLFIPLVISQATSISQVNYLAIAQSLAEPLERLNARLSELGLVSGKQSPSEEIMSVLRRWFEPADISRFFGSMISFAGNLIIGIFSVIFITFFFLREEGLFKEFIVNVFPESYSNHVKSVIDEISTLLTRYFGGILIQILLITMIVGALLHFIGVRNALLIGLFAGIINVIPYIGPFIGALVGVILTVSSSLDMDFYTQLQPILFKVVGTFIIVQLLDNFIFQPFILGSRVLAHPLEIFIIVMVGAKMGGIPGMILAIPLYTILRVIAKVFLSEIRLVQKLTRRMKEDEERNNTITT